MATMRGRRASPLAHCDTQGKALPGGYCMSTPCMYAAACSEKAWRHTGQPGAGASTPAPSSTAALPPQHLPHPAKHQGCAASRRLQGVPTCLARITAEQTTEVRAHLGIGLYSRASLTFRHGSMVDSPAEGQHVGCKVGHRSQHGAVLY